MRRHARGLALGAGALVFGLAGWLMASVVKSQPAVNAAVAHGQRKASGQPRPRGARAARCNSSRSCVAASPSPAQCLIV
jgi:hypothetical protein